MERLFKYFDRNCDGVVDYNEFLRAIRGEMNDYRKSLVQMAFKKLDKTGDNRVTIADLKGAYNVQEHPDVREILIFSTNLERRRRPKS